MINFNNFNNVIDLTLYFNTEEKCRQAIIEHRWPDGDIVCPYCGRHHCYTRSDGKYRCPHCLNNFTCLTGTVFQDTKLSLLHWFVAMYLISSHKKGVSSHQLARDLNVSQTTAWNMLQKIRRLYEQCDTPQYRGVVECDEVYIGGKERWRHKSMRTPHTQGRSTKTKTPIFGMMEHTFIKNAKGIEEPITYVHALMTENTNRDTLVPIIEQFIATGSTVVTDELSAYAVLPKIGYKHAVVRHNAEEYADGDITTNSVECFWSHFRRMITGCYHNVSYRHLQRYIDEACFRWNTRKMSESERFTHMFAMSIGLVVTWEQIKVHKVA